jgi:hypothetical protein
MNVPVQELPPDDQDFSRLIAHEKADEDRIRRLVPLGVLTPDDLIIHGGTVCQQIEQFRMRHGKFPNIENLPCEQCSNNLNRE